MAGAVAVAFAVGDDRPIGRRLGVGGLCLLSLPPLLAHNHPTALIGLFGIVVMAILLLGRSHPLPESTHESFHEPGLSALAAGGVVYLLFCVTPDDRAPNRDRHRPSSGDARASSHTRLPAAPRASPTDLGLLALGIAITAFAAMRRSRLMPADEREDAVDRLSSGAPPP